MSNDESPSFVDRQTGSSPYDFMDIVVAVLSYQADNPSEAMREDVHYPRILRCLATEIHTYRDMLADDTGAFIMSQKKDDINRLINRALERYNNAHPDALSQKELTPYNGILAIDLTLAISDANIYLSAPENETVRSRVDAALKAMGRSRIAH